MWEDLVGGIIGGGGGEVAGGAASGGLGDWLGGLFGGLDWGSAIGGGLSLAGTGLQAYNTISPMLQDAPGQAQWNPQMAGMQGQMGAGQVSPEMMRRRLSDAQAQGMSGASPDFLATMAGVSPDELQKMLGYGR